MIKEHPMASIDLRELPGRRALARGLSAFQGLSRLAAAPASCAVAGQPKQRPRRKSRWGPHLGTALADRFVPACVPELAVPIPNQAR
jgi:hypothetical protein